MLAAPKVIEMMELGHNISHGCQRGAIAAAAKALGMTRDRARQIAVDHPEQNVMGAKSFRALLTRRTLYPQARIRELARAIVGDRTFADFTLDAEPGAQPYRTDRAPLGCRG